jgi:hypothetical protein
VSTFCLIFHRNTRRITRTGYHRERELTVYFTAPAIMAGSHRPWYHERRK